jgi:hypothetical protein
MTSKSKAYRSNSRRSQDVSAIAVIVAGLTLVVAVGFVVFQIIQSSNRPVYVPEVQGSARIAVDEPIQDYGDQHYGVPVNSEFTLRNVGDQDLVILGEPQIKVVQGCCPPRLRVGSRTIRPGEETTIGMTFSMHEGMDGFHQFDVYVLTNDPVEPEKVLTVYSNWIP